jgi:hypothetical protein
MDEEPTLDEVLAEMVEVRQVLAELSRADHEQRNALNARLAGLRAIAARTRPQLPTDREALRLRLRRLEAELRRRIGSHVSQSAAAQTGYGGGIDPSFVHRLNRQIDKGLGVEELKAEIQTVRSLLSDS